MILTLRFRRVIGLLLISLFFLGAVSYGLFRASALLSGPTLTIDSPREGSTVYAETLQLRGVAENIRSLTLNGRSIFVDDAGRFREELALMRGYNILTLRARDRFGRERTAALHVIYK